MLPREKNALNPGSELKYNTPSTVGASMANGKSTSKNAHHTALDLGFQLKYNIPSIVGASLVNGKSTYKNAPHVASNGALLQGVH